MELLTTKFHVPAARPALVARPRLTARLSEGLTRPLTLISAPAGFGKTTLVAEWRASQAGRGFPLAWLALDPDDNDLGRFLGYFVGALQSLKSGLGEAVFPLPPSDQTEPAAVPTLLTGLVNALVSLEQPFALALDDYHVITAGPIQAALAFILDHLPPAMHLILLTRADPAGLPIARLRARDQLVEIRAADLRFTPAEAADFLNSVMRLELAPAQVAALERHTEGWIAGLQLAALSLQGRSDKAQFIAAFSGGHHYIVDYLAEEVLNRQPANLRAFLLRTSILDRLTGPLCDAVLDERRRTNDEGQTFVFGPSSSVLDELERANLFLSALDDEHRWHRFHPLFADVLRSRLRQVEPGLIPELHRRAAEWYARNGLLIEAVSHALAGAQFELAAGVIEQAGEAMLAEGGWGQVLHWLSALPAELVAARPALALHAAWGLVLTGRWEGVEEHLQRVEQAAGGDGRGVGGAPANWEAQVAAIRGRVAYLQGDFAGAIEHCARAIEHVPEADLVTRGGLAATLGLAYIAVGNLVEARRVLELARRVNQAAGNWIWAVEAAGMLAQIHEAQGRLHRAADTYREILRQAGQRIDPNVAAAHLNLGNVLYEWQDLEGAGQHLQAGLAMAELLRVPDASLFASLWLARARLAQGDAAGSLALLAQARQQAEAFPDSIVKQYAGAFAAQLALAHGDAGAARRWADTFVLPADESLGLNFILRKTEYLTWARWLLFVQRFDQAEQFLNTLQAVAVASGLTGCLVETFVLQALARQGCGDTAGALSAVKQALERGEQEGYFRAFVDQRPPPAELLRQAGVRGVAPAYVTRLLSLLAGTSGAPAGAQPLVEPLTGRELELLLLVAAGLSNRAIADRLVLAPGTVKKHLNNIFGKLGARSRTQCVARARELGLL